MTKEKHNYEYHVALDADSGPARVIRMVGENKLVLEIGAGPGSITKCLTHVSKCRVTALDIDAESIKRLHPHCERAYQADLNDPTWPSILEYDGKFEVLVAADVLEHVYEPLAVLQAMKGFLNHNGYMVISLPHAGHSVIHACLFDEDFEYNDYGLLDRTHIRFFGIKNIQNLFENAGMKIVHAEFVVRNPEHTEFSKKWAKTPQVLRDALASNPFGQVYQIIVKAVPTDGEGLAISLMDMFVPQQNPTLRESLRAFLRLYLSDGMYSKLLRLNELRRKFFVKTKF
ncbi:MAG: class I SAM-dependent methyltransferase [Methylotenera sp.]|nr:class I SAM-dependent methyltransferase [Methylotenera sp.]